MPSTSGVPQFSLTLGGRLFDEQLLRYVISIEVTESMDELDAMTLRMAVPELATEVTALLINAQPFTVTLGYGAETVRQVSGDIIEVSYRYGAKDVRVATLRGLDQLHRLKQKRFTRMWNMTHAAMAQTIALEHQLTAQVTPGSVLPVHEFQNNESNAAFLHRIARRNNYALSTRDGILSFGTRLPPIPYVIPPGNNLLDFEVRQVIDDLPTAVVARGWDYRLNMAVVGQSTSALLKRYSGGQTGAEVAAVLLGPTTLELDNQALDTTTACIQYAMAVHQQKADRFVQGRALVRGTPELLSGGLVTISGVGMASGTYLVRATTHTLEPGTGYRTTLQLMSDSLPIPVGGAL